MKSLKRLLAIALTLAMASATLAGCSGSPATSGGTNAEPKVELELLTWHGPDSATTYYKGYEQIAKDYNTEHPNVTIKLRYEADANFGSILETGFAGGTAPDIIQMKSSQRQTYKEDILNLREYLTQENPYDKRNPAWADNFEGGIDAFPVEEGGGDSNSLLFVPNDGNPSVFSGNLYIYNTKLIKDAGLDPEKTPTTWTDMFKWLEALKAQGAVAPMAGSTEIGSEISQIGFCFGEDYDSKFFDEKYNDPEFMDDLYWDKIYILTCYDKGNGMALDGLPFYPAQFDLISKFMTFYQDSWVENTKETQTISFASARAAMMIVGSWDYGTLTASLTESKFPDGYGTFRIPYMGEDTLDYAVEKGWTTKENADAARPYVVTRPSASGGLGAHDYGFTVNKDVKEDPNKLAATIDFLRYLSSYDQQVKYTQIANSFSPIKDVPVPETLSAFVSKEPEGGYAKRILGLFAVEWGISDWPVEMMKYLREGQPLDITIENITAPTWVSDIPPLDTLKANVEAAKAELDSADAATKEAKERALKYAELRRDIFDEYYYSKTGDLEELR